MTSKKQPLAKPWEVISCPSGHPMYLAVRHIYAADEDLRDAAIRIVPWDDSDSQPNYCPTCHRPILDKSYGLYVKGKKRGSLIRRGRGFRWKSDG